jgi:hypothetical protein
MFPLTEANQAALDEIADKSPDQPRGERIKDWKAIHEEHHPKLLQQAALRNDFGEPAEVFNRHISWNLGSAIVGVVRVHSAYDPHQVMGDNPTMLPDIAAVFKADSAATFDLLMNTDMPRALIYASLIDPKHHQDFGIKLNPEDMAEVEKMSVAAGFDFMDPSEVLMMRDYAHPGTGTFNLFRSMQALERNNISQVQVHVAEYRDLFMTSFDRMSSRAELQVRNQPLHKGLALDAHTRATMDYMVSRDSNWAISYPLSATQNPNMSYATRRNYGVELRFPNADATDVCVMHPTSTLKQAEVLLNPGQQFRLNGPVSTEFSINSETRQPIMIDVYTATRVDPR